MPTQRYSALHDRVLTSYLWAHGYAHTSDLISI